MIPTRTPATLTLSDGTVFNGFAFGSETATVGEVVFNTGMVGYPESLTDPSYRGQIIVYSYPLIGNYGVSKGPFESDRIQARGMIVANYQHTYSHWDATRSLHDWLVEENIPAITGIDTRALTKKLRTTGVMVGQINCNPNTVTKSSEWEDPNETDLVSEVSVKKPIWHGAGKKTVLLVDCGVKRSIIDNLVERGLRVKQVPWNYNYTTEFNAIDGILLSNGPGDPKRCTSTIAYAKIALAKKIPQFGICLGSQIQGLAAGAKTYKLKYGHRGQNQPCVYTNTVKCVLTSQNHGYAVRESSLPKDWRVLFTNANDGSVEGIAHKKLPFFSVQFHPEANPGPEDSNSVFDDFIKLL